MNRITAFLLGFLALAGVAIAAPAPITVPNIATLVAGNFSSYPTVQVLGYYTAGDGGGGMFNWNSASTATTDVCITFQTGGLTTGRFVRALGSAPLSLLMCGVKADGSTDNTTAIQAAFTSAAANNLGEVFCPNSSGVINFASTIVPTSAVSLRGAGSNAKPYLGLGTGGAPGTCTLNYTGSSGWALDYQTPVVTAMACPNAVAPSFRTFNLNIASTGSGIRLNNSATAGFTDNCALSSGQSTLFGSTMDGLVITGNAAGSTGIQISKAFDTTISNSIFSFLDTQVQVIGSDNVLQVNNKYNFAQLRAVDIQTSGTFGNFDSIRDNTFFSVYTGATDFIRSAARSGVIDGNYFEADFSGITSVLNLTCGLSQTVTNNAMELIAANVAYWLQVTGDCESIVLTNNYSGAGGAIPSRWNAGAGSGWFSNSVKQKITAWGNPDDNNQTPYATLEPVPRVNNAPAISGSVLANFDASSAQSISGNYASSIKIGPVGFAGAFVFTPQTAPSGHVTFKFLPKIQGLTYDLWILAASGAGTLQQVTVSDGTTTTTTTLASGTTPTWYKAINNGAVNDPTIDTYNNDTVHGQNVYIYRWQAVKH